MRDEQRRKVQAKRLQEEQELEHQRELAADARQGPWLRLAGAGGWVLTRHPVYGALVEILDS